MNKKIIGAIVGIILIGTLSYFGYNYHKNNGTKYEYYDDGTIEFKYNLKNGKLNGENTSYYPNGQIKYIKNYKNDYEDGECTYYFKNGTLKKHYFAIGGNTDLTKEFISYYSNGQIKSYRSSDNKYTEYFINGQIQTVGIFDESGQKIGQWKQFDDNGEHIATLIYKDGKPYSGNVYEYLYRFFDEDESEEILLNKIENYKDGELNGPQYEYYENGNLKKLENYKNGKEDGKQIKYKENGTISEELTYKNGDLQ